MTSLRSILATLLPTLAAALPAQSFVSNGDFSQGLTAWSVTGWAAMPQVETFDTTGLGASPGFACSPGTNQLPPLTLRQMVPVVPNIPLELYADVASLSATADFDGGTVDVSLGGQPVLSYPFGRMAPQVTRRGILCARFTTTLSGMQPLDFTFSRMFPAQLGTTPRVHLDNVVLQIELGPSFCLRGERTIGSGAALEVIGDPQARFAVLFAPALLPNPITIPGVAGTLWLDPQTSAQIATGTLDQYGQWIQKIVLPNDPSLDHVPLWFQAAQVTPALAVSIGIAHDFALHQ